MESTKQELLPFQGKMHVASARHLVQLCPALTWIAETTKANGGGDSFNLKLCSCTAQGKNWTSASGFADFRQLAEPRCQLPTQSWPKLRGEQPRVCRNAKHQCVQHRNISDKSMKSKTLSWRVKIGMRRRDVELVVHNVSSDLTASVFRVLDFWPWRKGSGLFQRPASYTRRQSGCENPVSLFHVILNSLFTSRSLFDVVWSRTFESVVKYTKKESLCQLNDLEAILCRGSSAACCEQWKIAC